jgi:alkylation response protein AidB-like acyl-CoA dehydrogenase
MPGQPIKAAHDLIPQIREARDQTESSRCIASTVVEGLRASRLARMAVVESLGGLETPTVEALSVYETLAGAEASVAWVVWNNSLPCLFSRFLSPHARAEIFADPAWLYANSTRPSGKAVACDGGYRVSGRWSLVSGCELAEWMAFLCRVEEHGQPRMHMPGVPEMRFVFLRKDNCEIIDTWYTGGLRGTGSHDVAVQDVLVSEAHSALPTATSTIDAPIGRVPIISTLGAGFAAQALGIAFAALHTVLELAKTKVSVDPTHPDLRHQPANQVSAAAHQAALQAARSHLHTTTGRIWDKAGAGQPVELDDISAVWGAALHANNVSRHAVDAMYGIGGTSSLYTACPLERAHRDIHAMMRHVISQPLWLENAGRVIFGLQPEEPLFAL